MRRRAAVLSILLLLMPQAGLHAARKESAMPLTLTSEAFPHGSEIPASHTCEGADTSPPLAWTGLPAGAKSLALIVDDPDAPQMTWVHWVLYNIPPATTGLAGGVSPAALPAGTRQGANDWHKTGYGGPCPPVGRHRYLFKLYALDVVLPDLGKASKATLEKAMHGHVLAQAELAGTYKKRS